jgi:hypothetical protein
MLAEVGQGRVDELCSCLGEDDLAAVAGAGDPRRAVHVWPHVTLLGHERRPRVHTHAQADRARVEALRDPTGSCERFRGSWKGDEERVALRVHLYPAFLRAGIAHHVTMLR